MEKRSRRERERERFLFYRLLGSSIASSELCQSGFIRARRKRDKGGGVCYGRMWILEKAFEVDCAEVAGHLVLYIHWTFAWNEYLSLKGSQAEKTSSPRLKMPPFSTDIDPRRCSSRDYTARSWFPSFSVSSRRKCMYVYICWTRSWRRTKHTPKKIPNLSIIFHVHLVRTSEKSFRNLELCRVM